jgi:site-specific recombinase XerD
MTGPNVPDLTNFEILINEKVIEMDKLGNKTYSEEAQNLINSLSPDEIKALISINNKLSPLRDEFRENSSVAPAF